MSLIIIGGIIMAVTQNNIARLKEEADIAAVIAYLQLPVTKRGNAFFILCPNPHHEDTRPTNCYYKEGWNHTYCCACGESTNAVNLIMQIQNISYGEACDILWEISGRPDWYYAKDSEKAKKRFSLQREEAELIGLHYPSHIRTPIGFSDFKEELKHGEEYADALEDMGNGECQYMKYKINRYQYSDFMSDEEYRILVIQKCNEMAQKLLRAIRYLELIKSEIEKHGIQDEITQNLIEVEKERRRQCFLIMKRAKKFKAA